MKSFSNPSKMKRSSLTYTIKRCILPVAALAIVTSGCGKSDGQSPAPASTKRERNLMKEGYDQYQKQRYAESEISYKKALGENPDNPVASFNLASTYLKQKGEDLANKQDSLIQTADAIFAQLSQNPDTAIAEASFYDRGNISFKRDDYAAAIEHYKNVLRRNPSNEEARENLRLAQLKKQEQDQNQDNQDQNQDKDNQDQQQQDQDKKDQDQQQNQDQNKDQQQDQKQDQQQQQQDQQQQDRKQEQQQQQQSLSQSAANQILKAMEDKENGTRQKVELMKQGEEKRANRRNPEKPW